MAGRVGVSVVLRPCCCGLLSSCPDPVPEALPWPVSLTPPPNSTLCCPPNSPTSISMGLIGIVSPESSYHLSPSLFYQLVPTYLHLTSGCGKLLFVFRMSSLCFSFPCPLIAGGVPSLPSSFSSFHLSFSALRTLYFLTWCSLSECLSVLTLVFDYSSAFLPVGLLQAISETDGSRVHPVEGDRQGCTYFQPL